MRAALSLVAIGVGFLVFEGALVTLLPSLLLPDIALVLSLAAALHLYGPPALLVLAGLSFASDLLGGAPLGLHVLALLVPFVAARVANGSLELRRGLPEAVLVGLLTPVAGIMAAACLWLAGVALSLGWAFWLGLALQTAVNALVAPAACALAEWVATLTGDLDSTRRGVVYIGAAPWGVGRR